MIKGRESGIIIDKSDVRVMVSPVRQRCIAATLSEESGYGKSRNMTPCRLSIADPPSCATNRSTQPHKTCGEQARKTTLDLVNVQENASLRQPEDKNAIQRSIRPPRLELALRWVEVGH
jgi:hypothetical protein